MEQKYINDLIKEMYSIKETYSIKDKEYNFFYVDLNSLNVCREHILKNLNEFPTWDSLCLFVKKYLQENFFEEESLENRAEQYVSLVRNNPNAIQSNKLSNKDLKAFFMNYLFEHYIDLSKIVTVNDGDAIYINIFEHCQLCSGYELLRIIEKIRGNKKPIIESRLIIDLFYSQGFNVNEEIPPLKSNFVRSFLDELEELEETMNPNDDFYLTYIAKTDIRSYYYLKEGEQSFLFKGYCGFINLENSSSFNILLDKPILLNNSDGHLEVRPERENMNNGYGDDEFITVGEIVLTNSCDYKGLVRANA